MSQIKDNDKIQLKKFDKKSLEYKVMWGKETEKIGTGKLLNHFAKKGYYGCKSCGNPLYSWQSKYDSQCGWPAFSKCYINSIKTSQKDINMNKIGIEIMCNKCGAHLGHIFQSKNNNQIKQRHCVNSVSIKYYDQNMTNLNQELMNLASKK